MIGFVLVSFPAAWACIVLRALGRDIGWVRQAYFATVCRLIGLKVVVRGRQTAARPHLLVANHISYLDIVALGSVARGTFVAKAEIGRWPFFGWMGRAGRTVFVERRRTATVGVRDELCARLAAGETLIMFPEATSNDGNRIRPFKSALFNVVENDGAGRPTVVQPVSLAYTRLNAMPLGVGWRPFFAWYGDMDLMPHLWQALRLGTVTVEVIFHPPVASAAFGNRKALAKHCETVAGAGVARLLAGRHAA